MKKLSLSTILIFSSLSISTTYYSFTVKEDINLELRGKEPSFISNTYEDSLINKAFVCPFVSTIDQETAAKIDAFIMKRLGVISSTTNLSGKQISVIVDNTLGKREVDYIFNTVKKKFLGPEDAPLPPVDRH